MAKSLILTFFILATVALWAQSDFRPGYVITADGDSLAGFVSYQSEKKNQASCIFRQSSKGSKQVFVASAIRAYGYKDFKRYESKVLPGDHSAEPVLVEVLVSGVVSLYNRGDIFYVSISDQITEIPRPQSRKVVMQGRELILHESKYKEVLAGLAGSCAQPTDKLGYSESRLTNYVAKVNECQGRAYIVYKSSAPSVQTNYRAMAGIDITRLDNDGFLWNSSPIAGVGVDFSFPRISERLSATLEVWYSKKDYWGNYSEQRGLTTMYREANFLMSYVKVPIGFRYAAGGNAIRPYAATGVLVYQFFDVTLDDVVEWKDHVNTISTEHTIKTLSVDPAAGFWAGVGIETSLLPNIRLFGEVRFEKVSVSLPGLIGGTNGVSFFAGLRF